MEISLCGFKLEFKPSFLALLLGSVLFGCDMRGVLLLILIALHELTHILTARLFGGSCACLTFLPFGLCAKINGLDDMSIFRRIIVLISGPFFNFILWLVLMDNALGRASLALALFNLLPLYPLDGGKILQALAGYFWGSLRSSVWVFRLSYALSVLIAALGILQTILFDYNITLLLLGFFLLKYNCGENESCCIGCCRALAHKSLKRAMPVRHIAFNENALLKTVLYRLGADYYTVAVIVGKNGIIASIDECKIRELVLSGGLYSRLNELLNDKNCN